MHRLFAWTLFLAAASASLPAQETAFRGPTLVELRRAADSQRGALPTEIRISRPTSFRARLSIFVSGQSDSAITASYPVFQVVFPDRWIMVDAAIDSMLARGNPGFRRVAFDSVQRALRASALNVVTHEHHDHIGGIVRAVDRVETRRRTSLTQAQWNSLRDHPNDSLIRVDSSEVTDFTVLPDAPFRSVAPGVVLVRAPGHTPGSQAVFVRLASGAEYVFAGDIAWHSLGIRSRRHKPVRWTRSFGGEDTLSIARQFHWLAALEEQGVAVVVSHDDAAIDDFVRRALLRDGLRLPP